MKKFNISKKGLISIIVSFGVAFITALSLVLGLVVFKPKKDGSDGLTEAAESVVVDGTDQSHKGGYLYVEDQAHIVMKDGNIKGASPTASGPNPTYGGAVFVANGGTFTLQGGTIDGCKATYGGAIFVEKGGTCIIEGGNILNDQATWGGGIFVDAGASLIIKGNTAEILKCVATDSGGGIYVYDGGSIDIQTSDLKITECSATNNGGGMYVYTGTNTIKGKILDNEAKNGAGIFIEKGETKFKLAQIKDNTATNNGGGVYINNSNANVTIEDTCEINDNSAGLGGGIYIQNGTNTINATIYSNTAQDGGGVYVNGGTNFVNNSITSNIANSGGGLFLNKGDTTIYSEVRLNTANNTGGGVYIGESAAVVSITEDCVLSENNASSNGGGIYNNNGELHFFGLISDCRANFYGGGIYIDSGINDLVGRVSKCFAVAGGGVYANNGNNTISAIIDTNEAINGMGGGMYIENSLSNNTFTVDAEIYDNSAKFGGGVYVNKGTNNFSCYIYDNDVYYDQEDVSEVTREDGSKVTVINAAQGAGVFLRNGINTFTGDCYIEANETPNQGGGVYSFDGDNTLGCVITENFSAYEGGGIYVNQGLCTISGLVTNNTATFGGGAYIAYREATAVFTDDCNISDNYADDGAGINVDHGTVTIAGYVGLNYANANGGGIFINEGTVQVDAYVEANEAQFNGGGVYAGATLSEVNFTNNAVIIDNTAGIDGGGIYAKYGKNTINATIDTNRALNGCGGGLCTYKGANTIGADAIINTNTASYGGGIYAYDIDKEETGSSIHESASIKYNEAKYSGGGLFIQDGKWDINGTFSSNFVVGSDAEGFGAGINIQNGKHTLAGTIEDCGFRDCQGTTYGGGVVMSFSTQNSVSIGDLIINRCSADNGGGLYIKRIDANLKYPKVINGAPKILSCSAVNGGGMYLENNVRVQFKDSTLDIQTCQATNGAGIYVSSGAKSLSAEVFLGRNTATYGGGAYIAGASDSVTLTGNIIENSATYGGGIWIQNTSMFIGDIDIKDNLATIAGGGIGASGGGTINIWGTSISGNSVSGTSTTTNAKGGGIYIEGSVNKRIELAINSQSSFQTEISRNNIQGTANYCYGGGVYIGEHCVVTVYGGSLQSNMVYTSNCNGSYGGTIYVEPTSQLTLRSGASITGSGFNKCADYGGLVFNAGTFNMLGGSMVTTSPDISTDGGVIAGYGSINLTGGTISMPVESTIKSAILTAGLLKINDSVSLTGRIGLGANAYVSDSANNKFIAQVDIEDGIKNNLICCLKGFTIDKNNQTFAINSSNVSFMNAVYDRDVIVSGVAKQALILDGYEHWQEITVEGGYFYYEPTVGDLGIYKVNGRSVCNVRVYFKNEDTGVTSLGEEIPILSANNNVTVTVNSDGTGVTITCLGYMFTEGTKTTARNADGSHMNVWVNDAILSDGQTQAYTLKDTSVAGFSSETLDIIIETTDFVFSGTTLTKYIGSGGEVTLPLKTTAIAENVFYDSAAKNKITKVNFNDNLVTIGKNAFYDCQALKTVTFSATNKLTGINESAFKECVALETVPFEILNNLQYISNSAFLGTKINTVTFSKNSAIVSIGVNAFCDCKSLNTVSLGSATKLTTIMSLAFENCTALTTITLPTILSTLASGIIQNCSALTSFSIPDSVVDIQSNVFTGCTSLDTLTIGNGISDAEFRSLDISPLKERLQTITIGSGVTTIPNEKFVEFKNLSRVNFWAVNIGDHAFRECNNLTYLNGSASVKSIGEMAFYLTPNNLSNFKDVIDKAITFINFGRLETIGNLAFQNRISLTSVPYIANAVVTNLKTVGAYAFANTGLTSVVVPNTVTTFGKGVFSGCSNLKEASLPTATTFDTIPELTFGGTALTTFTITENIKNVELLAFFECKNLAKVIILGADKKMAHAQENDPTEFNELLAGITGVGALGSGVLAVLAIFDSATPFVEIGLGVVLLGTSVVSYFSNYGHVSAFTGCSNTRIYTDHDYNDYAAGIFYQDWRMYDTGLGQIATCPKGPYACRNGCTGTSFLGMCCCESCPTHS